MSESKLTSAGFRPEIQGLRALAVMVVLIFHVWPNLLPGGYVGVDVFFVISGYLITSLLYKELISTQHVSLLKFYARRIRRLLPAATAVLLFVAFFSAILPASKLNDVAAELNASALYVQNWWLALQSVDYLAAENSPGPLQHYWSLSVEEQYYVFWPICMLLVARLGERSGLTLEKSLTLFTATIILLSFAYSVYLTVAEPGMAYFATTTRAWQLALGGFLAIANPLPNLAQWLRSLLALLGVVAIIVASLAYSTATAFPGYAAILPTVGAALILHSCKATSSFGLYQVLASRPAKYFGDISYSLYLWHWPVIIFMQQFVGRELGVLEGGLAILISCAIAHQSKDLIEDRFRHPSSSERERWLPFAMGFVLILAVLLSALAVKAGWLVQRSSANAVLVQDQAKKAGSVVKRPPHRALEAPSREYQPLFTQARGDEPEAYSARCFSSQKDERPKVCRFGSSEGTSVVLIGDAHAAQWLPTLQQIAVKESWRISTYLNADCGFGYSAHRPRKQDVPNNCISWSRAVAEAVGKDDHAYIFVSQTSKYRYVDAKSPEHGATELAIGISSALSDLPAESLRKVVFIRDTPRMKKDVPQCLAKSEKVSDCDTPRRSALAAHDPMVIAAKNLAGSTLLDMTDVICTLKNCPAIVGEFLVWRDSHRMTATFAASLSDDFWNALLSQQDDSSQIDFSELRPALQDVKDDNPFVYEAGCHVDQKSSSPIPCSFGATEKPITAFVVGDSHAAQWVPALDVIASRNGWHFVSHTKSACAFVPAAVVIGKNAAPYESCLDWGKKIVNEVRMRQPRYIIISQSIAHKLHGIDDAKENTRRMTDTLVDQWRELQALGAKLIIIRDTPRMGFDVPECLSGGQASITTCSRNAAQLLSKPDPLVLAASKTPDTKLVDLTVKICPNDICSPVIDNVIVWRDAHHLTATYASMLADALENEIGNLN